MNGDAAPYRQRRLARQSAAAIAACVLITAAWPLVPAGAVDDVGYASLSYGSMVSAPTAEKPQSKLWFNDGRWWGFLFSRSTWTYNIHRFNWLDDSWTDTRVVLEPRAPARGDVMWDGSHLYVASNVREEKVSGDLAIKVRRYSYDTRAQTYSLDPGFPIDIATGAVEAVVMDRDSTGILWATWTAPNTSGGRSVLVSHSTTSDGSWTAPYVPPVSGAATLHADDISALVAYRGRIGVMWSNQNEDAIYFASHTDGTADSLWSKNPALQGPRYADDHINMKSLQADASGQVYAAVKTSLDDVEPATSSQPLLLLLVLGTNGSWSRLTFGRVSDSHTRPLVLIDDEQRQLYMFASAPCCSGGTIYMKQTGLENLRFEQGLGTPFIQLGGHTRMNNPASTKQRVGSASGLLVIASDDTTQHYGHNKMVLGWPEPVEPDVPPPATAPPPTPVPSPSPAPPPLPTIPPTTPKPWPTVAPGIFGDGFESGDFAAWTTVKIGADGTATVQGETVGSGAYAAHLTATLNTGSLAYARRDLGTNFTELTVGGDFRVTAEGERDANVPLFRLYDGSGTRLVTVYRVNQRLDRIGIQHSGRHFTTIGTLALDTWADLSVRVVVGAVGSSTIEVKLDGALIYSTTTASLGTSVVRTIQIGNDTPRQAFGLVADDIAVVEWAR